MTELKQHDVVSIFDYNSVTGVLKRKSSGLLGYKNKDGYIVFGVKGKNRKAHRLIWLYVYGRVPQKPYEIDHINGDTSDNRLSNLRECTHAQNICNAKSRVDNSLGIKGVHPYRGGKYCAHITVGSRQINLGYFRSIAAAQKARAEAAIKHYGVFSRD